MAGAHHAAFLARVAADSEFAAGKVDTGFIERRVDALIPGLEPSREMVNAAATALVADRAPDPWNALVGFRANAPAYATVAVALGGKTHHGTVDPAAPVACTDGQAVLFWSGEAWHFAVPDRSEVLGAAVVADGTLRSPMPGRVVSVSVKPGQRVTKGQSLLALEAMKMEHALVAPFDGTVAELTVTVGDQVAENVTLARVEGDA